MTTILDIPGNNPPNPFSRPLQVLLTTNDLSSAPSPAPALAVDKTVEYIVTSITASSDPAHALWELWDAFLTVVVTSTPHEPHLYFLSALRAQPPMQLTKVRAGSTKELPLRDFIKADGKLHWQVLPYFAAQWHDVHDILEAGRDWDGVREPNAQNNLTFSGLSNSPGEYFLRF